MLETNLRIRQLLWFGDKQSTEEAKQALSGFLQKINLGRQHITWKDSVWREIVFSASLSTFCRLVKTFPFSVLFSDLIL